MQEYLCFDIQINTKEYTHTWSNAEWCNNCKNAKYTEVRKPRHIILVEKKTLILSALYLSSTLKQNKTKQTIDREAFWKTLFQNLVWEYLRKSQHFCRILLDYLYWRSCFLLYSHREILAYLLHHRNHNSKFYFLFWSSSRKSFSFCYTDSALLFS